HLIDEEIPIEVLDTYWKFCQKAGSIYYDIFTQETLEIDFEKIHQIPKQDMRGFIPLEYSLDKKSIHDPSISSSELLFDQIQELKIKELTNRLNSLDDQYQTLLETHTNLENTYISIESILKDTENKLRETTAQLQEVNKSMVFSKELIRELISLIGIIFDQLLDQNQYLLEYKFIKELLTSAQKISNLTYRLPIFFLSINGLQRLGEKESKDKLVKDIKHIGLLNINNKIGESIRKYLDDIELKENAYLSAQNNFDQIIQAEDLVYEIEHRQEILTPEFLDIIRQQAIKAHANGEDKLSKELLEFAAILTQRIGKFQQSGQTGNQNSPIEKEYFSLLLDTLFINSELENKGKPLSVEPVKPSRAYHQHIDPIDIIICVHNALEDVKKCLLSITKHTPEPYHLIIVDDGSEQPTRDFLVEFTSKIKNSLLIRNENARGYTRAANQGMQNSKSKFLVLINSDTIVSPGWLDGLYSVMMTDEKIGVVGPLSNTASWQSIPKLTENGDWALNPLPVGMSVDEMSDLITKHAAKLELYVPLLNGFCMMIRRDLINQIGYFNEDVFGDGYGEEDDFNIRAQKAGWKLAIADDVYIFHAQSKSYSTERRHQLAQRAGIKLRELHGDEILDFNINLMNPNRVLEGIRARTSIMLEIEQYQQKGHELFSGKKVLFILPVASVGGGANVVIDEARCMRNMGVDAQIFNINAYKDGFLQGYPHLDIPVVFGDQKDLISISSS
ncbi:MAG: glycosyltransferase, partial [Candidatus Kryptoniota bacterium]